MRVNKELRKSEFIPKKESQAPSYSKYSENKPAAEKDVSSTRTWIKEQPVYEQENMTR